VTSLASRFAAAIASPWLIAGDEVAAETSATGDPSTLISRPSLVTLAFRPLPNTGTPSIVWR
jgi:hypothetical protein